MAKITKKIKKKKPIKKKPAAEASIAEKINFGGRGKILKDQRIKKKKKK